MKGLVPGTVAIVVQIGVLFAQSPTGKVTRLDPALDAIVPPDATLEILKEDYFGSSEGPVWVDEGTSGYLLFSDQAANRIYKWAPTTRELSVFLYPAGYTGPQAKVPEIAQFLYNDRLYIQLMGSNGLALDREGRLVICARGDRSMVRIEKDGTRTTLADGYQGNTFNAPNDVVVKSDGSIYFSAQGVPPGAPPRPGIARDGIYRWKRGQVDLITPDFFSGLAFSPDEKIIYLVSQGKIFRLDVRPDGTFTNPRPFAGDSGADGLKVDRSGNVYFGASDGLRIVSPEGKHLGTIATGRFTNLGFGDRDRKTLYILIRRGLARMRLSIAGI